MLSATGQIPAGVPKSSVISLTLFNVYVNNIEHCFTRSKTPETCKYADDCTSYHLVPKGSSCSMQDAISDMDSRRKTTKWNLIVKGLRICGYPLKNHVHLHPSYV